MDPTAAPPRRRRRSRAEAEQEILDAAAGLLRERPLHDVTVSAIMERTTLSRKAFYVYFSDRYHLLTRLFQPLRARLDEANALFLEHGDTGDPRGTFHAVARFHAGPDGPLVRALHEASRYDDEARRVWHEFNEPVVAAFTRRIEDQIAAGHLAGGIDVESAVRALVGMNLHAFFDRIVGRPDVDADAIADSLLAVWLRVFATDAPLHPSGH